MDGKDALASSLSDEEAELIVTKQGSNMSPIKSNKPKEGYKFIADQNIKDGFNFASKSKIGNGNEHSSSEPDEDFEHIVPDETNGSDTNGSVPTTPTKPTTHKRTAYLASSGNLTNGVDGSPPSSPAPKKRKEFKDYCAEDDEKKRKREVIEKSVQESKARDSNLFTRRSWILLGLIALIVAIAYGVRRDDQLWANELNNVNNTPRYNWRNASANFISWTKDLKSEFPKQNRETWIALIAAISSTMKKTEPAHPAAITVLYPPSLSQDFVTCFLRKVGQTVNKAIAPLMGGDTKSPAEVKIIRPSALPPSSSISNFRSDIESYLKLGKAVITIDIDAYKSEDNLLQFHGLCDSFHAVDKRGTLFFPVRVPQTIFDQFEWIHERGGDMSNAILTDAWKNVLTADSGPALVARIADTVIVLNEGDKCVL